jgi:TP901 family phage tail tape measure protein
MITADALDVILRVQNLRGFQRGMAQASASVKGVGAAAKATTAESNAAAAASKRQAAAIGLVTKASKGLAIMAGVAVFESLKMGVGFDKQLAMIQTQAGASSDEVKMVRDTILNMNDAIARPEDLAKAAYFIESVGQRGTTAMNTLQIASEGAAMGNASVIDTAQTLAGIMKVGIPGAMGGALQVMKAVNATVGSGAMTLEDYNHAMGTGVLPVAKEYGLSLGDINGALAVFTDEHITGSSAMAQLATSFHFLTGATHTGEAALEEIGLTGMDMAAEMHKPRGLLKALTLLKTHLDSFSKDPKEQNAILQQILPGGRGRILHVLLNQLDNYQQKMDQQQHTQQNFTKSLAVYHQTAAYRIDHAWQQLQVDLIKLYDQIKTQGVDSILFIITILRGLIAVLILFAKHGAELLKLLVTLGAGWVAYKLALLGVWGVQKLMMASAWIRWWYDLAKAEGVVAAATLAADGAMLAFPGTWIALAIAAVVAGIVYMILHWKQTKAIMNDVVDWIRAHWLFVALVGGPIGIVIALLVKFGSRLKDTFSGLGGFVGNVFKGIINGIITGLNAVIKVIDFVIRQYNKIPGILRPTGKIKEIGEIGKLGAHHDKIASQYGAHPSNPFAPRRSRRQANPLEDAFGPFAAPRRHAAHAKSSNFQAGHTAHHDDSTVPAFGPLPDQNIFLVVDGKVLTKVVNKHNADRKARK